MGGGAHGGGREGAGPRGAKGGAGEGGGAVDGLHAHQGVLGAEDIGVDLVQGGPAQIVIAVAGGAGEIGVRHPVGLEGVQHPGGVLLGDSVDAGELIF